MTHVRALIWKLSFLRFFQTGFLRTTSEAFPSGGRWPGAAGSDEGATGYPTEQKNTGVQAAGRWARAFYKERLGTESPPHQSASQTASPQGEAAVSYRSTTLIPFVRNACPSPPSRGAGRYGRRLQVCRKKKKPTFPGSRNQRRWVQGGGNSSSLVFFPPFLTGEMEAAGRHPPGRCAPRLVQRHGPVGYVPSGAGPPAPRGRFQPAPVPTVPPTDDIPDPPVGPPPHPPHNMLRNPWKKGFVFVSKGKFELTERGLFR